MNSTGKRMFTHAEVAVIRQRLAKGTSRTTIAREEGVSKITIDRIATFATYPEVKPKPDLMQPSDLAAMIERVASAARAPILATDKAATDGED